MATKTSAAAGSVAAEGNGTGGGQAGPTETTYKPAGGAGGGGQAKRHPAFNYGSLGDPDGYRRYCAELAKHALEGSGGAMEALGSLKHGLKRAEGSYTATAKVKALLILRRAHRRYAGAERTAAKRAIAMAAARAKADEVLIESTRKKKAKGGAYVAGGGKR